MATKTTVKLYQVPNCKQCPNCKTERTEGAGYAVDFICTAAGNQLIAGYVEWNSESPQDGTFPEFCPLVSLKV